MSKVNPFSSLDLYMSRIDSSNILTMEIMNSILFPVSYKPSFSRQVLLDPSISGFLFFTDKSPVGLCTYQTNSSYVYLMTFGVLKEYRGRGVGTKCILMVEEEILRTVGRRRVRLHVHENNLQGIGFYFKNGYYEVGIDHLYYSDMVPKTALILEKVLGKGER